VRHWQGKKGNSRLEARKPLFCSFFIGHIVLNSSKSLLMPANPQLASPEIAPTAQGVPALTPLEIEAIDLFISLVKLMGMPKSVGELYGLLFVAPEALPMDALMERLQMSKGAASQGLKLLRSFGAVKTTYVAGDRRDHYLAEFDLSRFASGFIEGELQPHLDSGLLRLERMQALIAQLPGADREVAENRLARLRHWHEKGSSMIPWILKFLVS
jgi:DNA-binding transcriptional regulator GbsR (MarR family)